MQYKSIVEVKSMKHVGDVVYACMYAGRDITRRAFDYPPMKGEFTASRSAEHDAYAKKHEENPTIMYFVPYADNGALLWYNAIEICKLYYADTEDEAIAMYNACIDADMDYYKQKLTELEEKKFC